MNFKKPVTIMIFTWIMWAILIIGFQKFASARLQFKGPDTVLEWTEWETSPGAHDKQPYLLEPFLNHQVAYDSEFYISIAVAGYDDPSLRAVWLDPNTEPTSIWDKYPQPYGIPNDFENGSPVGIPQDFVAISLNYAFFPFYPLLIRLVSFPLQIFGLNAIATATLAGVLVSVLGALGGVLALYELTRDELEDKGGLKAGFYLLVFPTGFFLAMVHTEGLFVGLAFGSLALLKRKRWVWAALLAACATVTRAVGGALVIPLIIAWFAEAKPLVSAIAKREMRISFKSFWNLLWKGALSLSPLVAYGVWYALLGKQFHAVEAAFFSRGAFEIERSIEVWKGTYLSLFNQTDQTMALKIGWAMLILTALISIKVLTREWVVDKLPRAVQVIVNALLLIWGAALAFFWFTNTNNEQRTFYYMVEFSATALAIVAGFYTLHKYPGLALFSLMVVLISFFSGVAQGMHRYILGAPAVFVMLGDMGDKNEAFDRGWTIASVLLMGLFAMLFAFNFWVG